MTSLAALLPAAGAAWLALRAWRYRRGFALPARRDDRYHWSGPARTFELSLERRRFALPADLHAGDTALLQVSVRAWPGLAWGDPWIEMRAGRMRLRQYLDRGARGLRYLNLSPLLCAEPRARNVRLQARGLRLASRATLSRFPARIPAGATVLVVAPHPDDAELAAFHLYSRHRSWVVTLTAGDRMSSAEARVAESLAVPVAGGVAPRHCLNLVYPDGALAAMRAAPTREFQLDDGAADRGVLRAQNVNENFRAASGCHWRNLVADLRAVLDLSRPEFVATPHPLLDDHADHVTATLALLEALECSAHAPALLLYTVHLARAPCHPPGTAEGVISMPPGQASLPIGDAPLSLALDPAAVAAKRAALLSMSAVRSSAYAWQPGARRGAAQLLDWLAGLGAHPASLLRRACRPNELFQLASLATVRAMVGDSHCTRTRSDHGGAEVA